MGHIHAAAMAEYAKDAVETDLPWKQWEVSLTESGDEYQNLLGHPVWAVTRKYRRKPETILINGHEVGCPVRAGIGPANAAPKASRPRLPRASGDRPCGRLLVP